MSAQRWIPRVEDDALVRGRGRFADDAPQPDQAIGHFLRSPHAHARIRAIDAKAARAAPGVLAVLTAADLEGVGNLSRIAPLIGRGGKPLHVPHRPALARERAMHVGEPVALVVAETLWRAQDAAERIVVEYEELPAVTTGRAALAPGAAQLWPDAPGNLAIDWPGFVENEANDRDVDRIIANAPHVARLTVVNQRLAMASLEPRGATASYDAAADGYLLRSCSQSAGVLRDHLAGVMGIAPDRLRVISEDVGGAFGMKTLTYPEYPALLVAARKLGRPVHWMSTRAEAFLSDNQARDLLSEAELALDADGRFLALRVRNLANVGAYVTGVGAHIPTLSFSRCLPTVYAIPKIALEVRCVFTNTVPTGPYRGAGRPEANYVMERLVEEAARVSGIDRAALRRKNFIAPSALPYRNALGGEFDSGEFEAIFDETLRRARYADFPRRRAEAERRGKLRGFGISCFLEHAGAQPKESAAIVFPGGSELSLQLGVGNTGQGHATAFSRFLAGHLGIDAKHVRVRQGDSRYELAGYASVGSRSAMTAGNAAARAAEVMLAKGKAVAATLLEAAETDIEYRGGLFAVKGTDRRLSLFEVAERAKEQGESLDTKLTTETPITYPNGCHVAEVEIDPDTGKVAVVAYAAVDDCGTVLDHTLVEGQVQGGVAQGLGQTLLEHMVYDGAGQPVTGTFMDYAMPRADEVPSVAGELHPVPARTNPLGIKGVGEAGTTASLAAIINALNDAIPGAALDMPATPEKVWRACQNNLSPPPERGTSSADAKRRRAGRGRARR